MSETSGSTGLLQQLFDEVASFPFEELANTVGCNPLDLLSEKERTATTLTVKITDDDFEYRDRFRGITPWNLFFVSKAWYDQEENPVKFGSLFPAAIVCSTQEAFALDPFSLLNPQVKTKLKAIAGAYYLVLPIKFFSLKNYDRRLKFKFIGANFYQEGNFYLKHYMAVRDLIIFGKPLAGMGRGVSMAQIKSYTPNRVVRQYIEAITTIKDFINNQAYSAVEGA